MAQSVGIRTKGLKETIKKLERLGVEVNDIKAAMQTIAKDVVDDAKSRTPVKSGRLRNSIKSSRAKNKIAIRMGNSGKLYYASFIEYGTSKISARRMVQEALATNKAEMLTTLERELARLASQV